MVPGWFRKPPHGTAASPRNRTCLSVEQLEARDTPAAPVLSLNATLLGGKNVLLSGYVSDETPASAVVNVSGVVSGSAKPDANGSFVQLLHASALGTITAVANDQEGLISAAATAVLTSAAPSLTFTRTYGPGGSVTLAGIVTDEEPGGRTVTFKGAVSGVALTDAEGKFSFTAKTWAAGVVDAETEDPWGLVSAPAKATLSNTPPVIVDFEAIEGADRIWTFRGRVVDEAPAGLMVRLGGIPSLEGVTARVGEDGCFCVQVRLRPGEEGTATARVLDWWDEESVMAMDVVWQT